MEDVAHDPVLNVSERGDRAVIGKFEGQDLTHPWAGNVVDLCPVGALLSKDFLNKARSWDLDRSAIHLPGLLSGLQRDLRDARQRRGANAPPAQRRRQQVLPVRRGPA